jgi:hypothetical protein
VAAAAVAIFLPLPLGRPGLRFSGTPPPTVPPALGLPMADMVGLCSSEVEEEEKVECALVLEKS